jgi:hypothetical protein
MEVLMYTRFALFMQIAQVSESIGIDRNHTGVAGRELTKEEIGR